MRKSIFRCTVCFVVFAAFFVTMPAAAKAITVEVNGHSGPWDPVLNSHYPYGDGDHSPPTLIDAGSGIEIAEGKAVIVTYKEGKVRAGGPYSGFRYVDADGEPPYNSSLGGVGQYGTYYPGWYIDHNPVFLMALVGTFADATGKIVGSPFFVGNGPTVLTVPAGASRLQLGINDDKYNYNEGSFTVEVMGGIPPLELVRHTPERNEENVLWDDPDITLEFSSDVDPETLKDNVVLVHRDQSKNIVYVPVDFSLESPKKVRVIPRQSLRDGIRYAVRAKQNIQNKYGANLNKEALWHFRTMVNLDGQTAAPYLPEKSNKDKIQITWFNAVRNKDLVQGKPVSNRVYVNWDLKNDVCDADEAAEIQADVTLAWNGFEQKQNKVTLKRPDRHSAADKRGAKNTVNFPHMGRSTDLAEEYTVKIVPRPQNRNPPKEFVRQAKAPVRKVKQEMNTNVYTCEMAGWYNGVNKAQLDNATKEYLQGISYTEEVLPLREVTNEFRGVIPHGAGGFDMTFLVVGYSKWWDNDNVQGNNPACENVRYMTLPSLLLREEIRLVAAHLSALKPASHPFIIGLVPDDALPCANGLHIGHVILFSESKFNASTVAHEIIHEYGPPITGKGCTSEHNNNGRDVEGFRVVRGANKSFTEGNGESAPFNHTDCDGTAYTTSIVPVMNQYGMDTENRWIRPDTYQHLLGQLTQFADAPALSVRAASGDWLVVQGSMDEDGNITAVYPLYRIVQQAFAVPDGGNYTASLFTGDNGTGSSPGVYAFDADTMHITYPDGSMAEKSSGSFLFCLPFDTSAKSLVLTGPSNRFVVNASDFGTEPPLADFISPAEGSVLSGVYPVSWTRSDDVASVLYSRLEYSPDGTDWIPLAHAITGDSFPFDTTSLPSGEGQKLALIVSDGFNSTRREINISIHNGPAILMTSPTTDETGVGVKQRVMIQFATEMEPETLTENTFSVSWWDAAWGWTKISGTVSYDNDTRRAFFTPLSPFLPDTKYQGLISSSTSQVRDVYGNIMQNNYAWTFTTGNFSFEPEIGSVHPAWGAWDVPVNGIVVVFFDNAVAPETIHEGSFLLTDPNGNTAPGTVAFYDNSYGRRAVFTPSENLSPDTQYTATLTTDVRDALGNPLSADYSWVFTTGDRESGGVLILELTRDRAEDSDGDGLYDKLFISGRAEVLNPTQGSFYGRLVDLYGMFIAEVRVIRGTSWDSNKGVYEFTLEIPGSSVASHGVDGPFELRDVWSNDHPYPVTYRTQAYKAAAFRSPLHCSELPHIALAAGPEKENLFNLETYFTHDNYSASDLEYALVKVSDSAAGISLDAERYIDIRPLPGFSGSVEVTVYVRDQDGVTAMKPFRVNLVENYNFPKAGWAAISLANRPADTTIADVLAPLDKKYDVVWGYRDGIWDAYEPGPLKGLSGLSTIEPGWGYWIRMNQAGAFSSIGSDISRQPIELKAGWNLVGFNSGKPMPVRDALFSIEGRYTMVWSYTGGKWKMYDPENTLMSDLTEMTPGCAYWIRATEEVSWTPEEPEL